MAMRVYFNTSALNRPLDALSSERVRRVTGLLRLVGRRVKMSDAVVERARALEGFGLRGLDALHIASAEAGHADLLVTTDDRMIQRAARAGSKVRVPLVGPVEALTIAMRRRTR